MLLSNYCKVYNIIILTLFSGCFSSLYDPTTLVIRLLNITLITWNSFPLLHIDGPYPDGDTLIWDIVSRDFLLLSVRNIKPCRASWINTDKTDFEFWCIYTFIIIYNSNNLLTHRWENLHWFSAESNVWMNKINYKSKRIVFNKMFQIVWKLSFVILL